MALVALAAVVLALPALRRIPFAPLIATARTVLAAILRFLQRGIPEIDAGTAGIFRIVLGLLLILFFWSRGVDSSWLTATFDLEIEGAFHAAVIDWLRAHPAIVNLVTPWLLVTGAAFTIGLFTRTTYALFVAGVMVWAYVAISLESIHPLGALMLALVALLPSKWGDALSVDSWRRGAAPLTRGRHYGYSVWVPGLVFGVGYAAAAWAKMAHGPRWILNGTVKYHFITDSNIAPFDWGLQLASYPRLAIAASFFAVATEALLITAAFTRSEAYRALVGLAAFGLLSGFWVFMGHFWPGWWILLIGFLPWEHISQVARSVRPQVPDQVGPAASRARGRTGVTAGAAGNDPLCPWPADCLLDDPVERAPMFSHYPMYAGTLRRRGGLRGLEAAALPHRRHDRPWQRRAAALQSSRGVRARVRRGAWRLSPRAREGVGGARRLRRRYSSRALRHARR